MIVHVRMFARAKDLAGTSGIELDLAEGATVADLRRRLAQEYVVLAPLLERCAIAVDDEFAGDDVVVHADAKVALLPPVSGGQ